MRRPFRRNAPSAEDRGLKTHSDQSTAALAAAPFAPAGVVLAIWVAWMLESGGYFARDWYPAAIVLTLLVAVIAVARGSLLPPSRPAQAALAALAAVVGWAFLSLLWADSRGSALEAANQLLLYLAGAWALSLVPWRSRSAIYWLATWSVTIGVLCAVSLVGALTASDLGGYIVDSRWSEPTRYANATAALAAMAFWPAVLLASRRQSPVVVQVLGLCLAVFLIEFALLPQSRGSVIATLAVTPVFVALWPSRFRLLPRLAVVAGAVAMTAGPISEIFNAALYTKPVEPVLDHAAELMLISLGLTAVAGLVLALAEHLIRPSERAARRARYGFAAIAALVVLGGVALAAANHDRIERSASSNWEEFTSNEPPAIKPGPRLSSYAAYARQDMWRVAVDAFSQSPVHGVGAGNFESVYTAERTVEKPSRYAHSIWLRFLAEGGVVGAVLFLGFLGVVFAGLVGARRALEEDGRAVIGACVAVLVYFLAHASVDWIDVMPVLAAPALALPFVALVAASAKGTRLSTRAQGASRAWPATGAAVAGVAGAAALVALTASYLSVRYMDRAWHRSGSNPADALRDFDRSASLNPLSIQPHLAAGTLAVEDGRDETAFREFRRALEIEEHWYPHLELALLEARRRRRTSALQEIAQAARLNPRNPVVNRARRAIESGAPVDPAAINREVLGRPVAQSAPGQ